MINKDTKEGAYAVLDDIREHGTINMWETPQFLREELGLSRAEAKEAFLSWIQDRGETS